MEFVRVGSLGEIPEGEARAFDTPSGRLAVAHVDARVLAFDDACTHLGCSLAEGSVDDREVTVTCPCHASVFDLSTGEPVEGPAEDSVPVFDARVVDGWVEVATTPRDA